MRWKKYTLYTREEAVDLVSATFAELGIEGIEIEDNAPLSERDTKGMFIDILPELPPDDGTARVSFYLEPGSGEEEMLCRVREELEELSRFTDLGEARIEESLTEDKDWINNWKTFFHPFVVDDILIKPTWEQVPAESAGLTCIQIDPGTAFGTGAHETTQLCIRALNRYMRYPRVGCGNGQRYPRHCGKEARRCGDFCDRPRRQCNRSGCGEPREQ